MHSYKQVIQFGKPLKSVEIVPENPPPPPPPTFSEEEVAQREATARNTATQQTTERMNQEMAQLREQTHKLQQGILAGLESQFNAMVSDMNQRIPNLVIALTKKVLAGHTMDIETVKNIITEATNEISTEKEKLEVSLSESDFELMKSQGGDFVAQNPNMSFRKDSNLVPGDCMISSRFGLIDARLETKLAKIASSVQEGDE